MAQNEYVEGTASPGNAGFMRQLKGRIDKRARATALLLLLSASMTAGVVRAGEPPLPKLKTETQEAFEHYVKLTEARNEAELKRGTGLLWIDGLPEEQREQGYAALKRGEAPMKKLEIRDNGEPIACPGGMIHHWTGVIFIPEAELADVLGVLEDYDKHSVYYAPDVERSRTESRDGDHFRIFYRIRRHKVITAVLDTEFDIHYFRDAPNRAHSRGSSIRIAQVENAGKSDEREKAPGDDDGYMWGMETWWRMEERDGGVYVQSEVASLARDIPTGLGWLIKPFIRSVPRESLTSTLEATRRAVEAHRVKR